MKKVIALFILCSSLNSQAATQALTISGSVSSVCAFSGVVNGIFGFDVLNPNVLDTQATGGLDAGVILYYNSTPTVTVPEITSFTSVPSGFTDTVNFTNVLTTTNGSRSYANGTASWTESSSTSTDALTLRIRATNANGSFPVGNYSASTTITCQ